MLLIQLIFDKHFNEELLSNLLWRLRFGKRKIMHIIHAYTVKDLLSVDRCCNSLDEVACAIYVAHEIQLTI